MRLIRGAPGAGKTALVLREFKDALRLRHDGGSTPLRLIVPTATLVRHLRHELARDRVVFPPTAVVSLHRFIAECSPDRHAVPAALRPAIVRKCLEELRPPELSRLLEADGLAACILETIDRFENEGVTPERLSGRRLNPLGRAFVRLWRAIDRATRERGYEPRPALIREAASGVPSGCRIWMDGFVHLSPLEQEFVAALASANDLTLTVSETAGSEEIRRFALGMGALDRIVSGPPRRPAETVVEAPSPEREADEIARRILALHDGGIGFRQIGVALRDTDGYLTLLQARFERFGIPARFYFGQPLANHPAAIFTSGLIAGALEGWDHETALDTFRAHPRIGHTADFDRFDFKVREVMPGHGAETFLTLCESEWLRRDLAAWLRIEAWKTLLDSPGAWQRRIERFLTSEYRPGSPAEPSGHAAVAAARSHTAALNALLDALESAVSFFADPGQPVSLETFWRAASTVICNTVFRIPDDRTDVVHVMNVYEARQWDLEALIVCGLTDRDFPRRGTPNLFFPDGAAGPDAAQQEHDERALFESLRTRATGTLILTYPAHDATGRSVERSRFLAEIGKPENARRAAPAVEPALPRGRTGRIADPGRRDELVRMNRTASMTSLEALAQCRFKFFAAKTLGLKPPPDRPSERLQPRATGSILHKALESWQNDRTRDFVELFEQAFEDARRDQHFPPGYQLELKRLEFRRIAERVAATEQWASESTQAEVSLEIELPLGVTVTVRIDRLDLIGGRDGRDCVIVDYKSGSTKGIKQKLESETHLQGPLYALAVRERRGLNPVAVVFWAVRDDERYGWGHIPGAPDSVNESLKEMPANWATQARARIEERLAEFFHGAVTVQPLDPALCRWCEFAGTCRVEQSHLVSLTQPGSLTAGARE